MRPPEVFVRLLLGERIVLRRVIGLVVGFAGVVVMFSSQLRVHGHHVFYGMAFALVGGIAWAGGTLAVKALADRDAQLDPLAVTTLQYLLGSPVLVVIGFASDGTSGTQWSSPAFWGAAAYVAFGAAIGTIAFFAALRRLTATRTASVQFLIPVVAVLVELARGVRPTAIVLVGMVLAIAGVGIVLLPAWSAQWREHVRGVRRHVRAEL